MGIPAVDDQTPPGQPGGVRRSPGPAELARAADDLVRRLRRWTAASWALAAGPEAGGTRGDAAYAAVQRIADLGADAEGEPRRPVPRLADTVLADQLAVMVGDAVRTGDPTALAGTAAELTALRRALGLR